MKLTHKKIQKSSTDYLKSVIKDGFADIETEDMIFKELFEIDIFVPFSFHCKRDNFRTHVKGSKINCLEESLDGNISYTLYIRLILVK